MATELRHDQLLRHLRRRHGWTIAELADQLEVSRRTVLRDIDHLRSRGFDIASMTGPGGGVRLEPTSVLVTSQLDGADVVALIVSSAVAQATPGVPFASGAARAISKIEAALPSERVRQLQTLMSRILVGEPLSAPDLGPRHGGESRAEALPSGEPRDVDPGLLVAFESAFTEHRLLRFRYTDRHGRSTSRVVEPHGLLVRAPIWYVIAWDRRREAARLFRADRIADAEATSDQFTPRPGHLVTGVCPDATPALARADASRGRLGSLD